MSKEELDDLVRINRLKSEPGSRGEFTDLIRCTKKLETAVRKLDPPAGE